MHGRTTTLLPLVLTACASLPHRPPVSEHDKALAQKSIAELQSHWNGHQCAPLFPSLLSATPGQQEDWLLDCETAQRKWGEWNRSDIQSWMTLGAGEFSAEGDAQFEKRKVRIYSVWRIEASGSHSLLFLQLVGDGMSIGHPIGPNKHIDPPVPSRRAPG